MSTESFTLRWLISASPETLYRDWLSSEGHSALTGSPAQLEPGVGGRFTCWGGYISGENLSLVAGEKLVQRWRTSAFPEDSADSLLTLTLSAHPEGTELLLSHEELPCGQSAQYKEGWFTHYLQPLTKYYSTHPG